ncbi:MAG: hypothetical protein ACRCZZ_10985 [Phocaeicola sp.]
MKKETKKALLITLTLTAIYTCAGAIPHLLARPVYTETSSKVITELPTRFVPGRIETLDVVEPAIGRIETLDVVEVIEAPVYEEPTVEAPVEQITETPAYEESTPTPEPTVEAVEVVQEPAISAPVPEKEEPVISTPTESAPEKEEAPDGPTLGVDALPGPPSEEDVQNAFPDSKN